MKAICALFDRVAGMHTQPEFVPVVGVFYRNLQDAMNAPPNNGQPNFLAAHAADYDVVLLGSYDEATGVLTGEKQPKVLCALVDLRTVNAEVQS